MRTDANNKPSPGILARPEGRVAGLASSRSGSALSVVSRAASNAPVSTAAKPTTRHRFNQFGIMIKALSFGGFLRAFDEASHPLRRCNSVTVHKGCLGCQGKKRI